ncbi:MAG: hypothetical protein E7644_05695 [Ruminococcaceae bacterium]|nr:hypothetical protein [Oscillospiraceae bacterium]
MMKKKLLICLLALLLCACSALPAFAAEAPDATNVTLLENGSRITETCEILSVTTNARSSTQTISGRKAIAHTNDDGSTPFVFYIYATFEVNYNVSVTCVSTYYEYEIADSSWKFDSASTWCDGEDARGTYVFKEKVLFITTTTVEGACRLSCTKTGTLY